MPPGLIATLKTRPSYPTAVNNKINTSRTLTPTEHNSCSFSFIIQVVSNSVPFWSLTGIKENVPGWSFPEPRRAEETSILGYLKQKGRQELTCLHVYLTPTVSLTSSHTPPSLIPTAPQWLPSCPQTRQPHSSLLFCLKCRYSQRHVICPLIHFKCHLHQTVPPAFFIIYDSI